VFVWDGDEYVPYGTVLPTQDEQITTVVDQTARLALTAVVNDFAVQTDNNLLYQLRSLPASTDTNWSIISPSTS
jgi:hypothetical protein